MRELTPDQKREMIETRCQQFLTEIYGHELTLIALQAQEPDEGTTAAIEQAEGAINVLTRATDALVAEAERLGLSAPVGSVSPRRAA